MRKTRAAALGQLGTLFDLGAIRELTDGQLLERYTAGRGEIAELAFAVLVERHGAMVLRVCRSRLGDAPDCDDAFQATFLVLVQKARGLWVEDTLGPWLHRVAVHASSCARAAAVRRRAHERGAAEQATLVETADDAAERAQALHAEINRLPERYRVPIVLCDLEGKTCEEAARQMGRPVGTVKSWRARGRARLRSRLVRAGLAPAVGGVAAGATGTAQAACFSEATPVATRAEVRALTERMIAGKVPASVGKLVQGVTQTMLFGKLQMTAAALLTLVFLAAGLGTLAQVAAPPTEPEPSNLATASPAPTISPATLRELGGEIWQLSLDDAMTILMDNAPCLRVVSLASDRRASSPRFVIAPLRGDVEPLMFRAEVMAAVRSLHQLYRELQSQYVMLEAQTRRVKLAEDLWSRTADRFARGKTSESSLREATVRLDQCKAELTVKKSDVKNVESRLRAVLYLPLKDERRIVPITAPVEAEQSLDWDECLQLTTQNKVELGKAWKRISQAISENRAANEDDAAKTAGRESPTSDGVPRSVDSNSKRAFRTQLAFYQKLRRKVSHDLARFYLEVEANYKQFQAALQRRSAAALRLDAERVSYEEGQTTLDRYLDVASLYASAVAEEAQFKTTYNIAIIGLEEAKGTLLDHERIAVDESIPTTSPSTTRPRKKDRTMPASLAPLPPPVPALAPASPALPAPYRVKTTEDSARVYSLQLTVRVGATPVEFRAAVTVPGPASPAGAR